MQAASSVWAVGRPMVLRYGQLHGVERGLCGSGCRQPRGSEMQAAAVGPGGGSPRGSGVQAAL